MQLKVPFIFSPSSFHFNLSQLSPLLFAVVMVMWYLINLFPLQFSLTPSPPLALPLQLSAQRACLPPQITAPPSSWVALPAETSSTPSPKASQSLPSAHQMTLCPLLPPLSTCLIPLKAPTPLPCCLLPPQLQLPLRSVAAWGQMAPKPLHHDLRWRPVHWLQEPSNLTR